MLHLEDYARQSSLRLLETKNEVRAQHASTITSIKEVTSAVRALEQVLSNKQSVQGQNRLRVQLLQLQQFLQLLQWKTVWVHQHRLRKLHRLLQQLWVLQLLQQLLLWPRRMPLQIRR